MSLDWTKREFEVYVLLYAAHCNHIETKEERAYILSKVDEATFNKMHTEIVVETEHQNLEKIQTYLNENSYSIQDKRELIQDIKEVFFADGTVDAVEKKVFSLLQKILS
ncbi:MULTISPECIES: hypothetical protein [Tenacibaculum]|uniref:TerB family tellurite resistance protein n=1 Tax=Tenacibaculum aiptasiae TaxID=426481 RepID=A0A7J5APT4_9FLAO|nr:MULTISPECIES: hypothetical protein [Tenacibaculum]KAB1159626.1 hypothetical protein F7018_04770 [Tenacibaculum aiptasiae]MCF2873910.1 hypothetical protein [Tenacibaculum sp. Cn5-1]MCF2936720.1 hypothetical protein [Tenacibaculum sp. Cn5-34]MCG7512944.1 hypothetical protein [Tenacibaculum sp. Cn5-46]